MGNCVGVTLSFSKNSNCFGKIFDINNSCDWRRTMPHPTITITDPTNPTFPLTLPSQTSRICTVLSENVQCVLARQLNNSSFTLCVIHWILSVKFCLHIPKLPQTHRLSLHNTANVQVMLNSICSPILILFMFCVPFMF